MCKFDIQYLLSRIICKRIYNVLNCKQTCDQHTRVGVRNAHKTDITLNTPNQQILLNILIVLNISMINRV